MKIDDIRENLGQFWGSFSEGWDRLRHTAAGALTRFRPGEQTQLPERHEAHALPAPDDVAGERHR